MSNTNKSHSKLNTSLSFWDSRIAVNMFCTVFVRIASVNPTRLIWRRVWIILILSCHVLSLRHSSRYLLKKYLPNYRYLHELPHQFYWGICVAQYFSSTAYVTTSRYCFYRKWNFSWKCRFSPNIGRIGQNEFQICFLRHFLHSIRKTCIFGFTCPLNCYFSIKWIYMPQNNFINICFPLFSKWKQSGSKAITHIINRLWDLSLPSYLFRFFFFLISPDIQGL